MLATKVFRELTRHLLLFILIIATPGIMAENSQNREIILLNFNKNFDLNDVKTKDASIRFQNNKKNTLNINMGTSGRWPTITFHRPANTEVAGSDSLWDLSSYNTISLTVGNPNNSAIKVYLRVDSPIMTNMKLKPRIGTSITIPANGTRELSIQLSRGKNNSPDFVGMKVPPSGLDSNGIDPARISAIRIFTDRTDNPVQFDISNIKATGNYTAKPWEGLNNDEFFPFIDTYGQFIHDQWPGKISNSAELIEQKNQESKLLEKNRIPRDWDTYGGWKNGPKLKASGHFRIEKVDNIWWLINPQGRLFWSHGIDVIKPGGNHTITSGREHYFSELPDDNDALGKYNQMVKPRSVSHGHYRGKTNLRAYDFSAANLHRKYGKNWKKTYPDVVHKRLRHWGMNTIGLWSDPHMTSMKKTAYVEWMYYQSPKTQGKTKRWKRMVDMWHPKFKPALNKASFKIDKIKNDPWLIGIFVDNELAWQDATGFANEVLSSPATQAAKIKFIEQLKDSYVEIAALNNNWKTKYATWQTMQNRRDLVKNTSGFKKDATTFFKMSTEHYYKTVRDTIKQKAPEMLYLCSRFAGNKNPIPVFAAAKYCDVISYNLYADSVDGLSIPKEIDKPVIIGEWHFGADDRGVFGKGLRGADSQNDRALKYTKYAQDALKHPKIVGLHWFQYRDQMTTGRVSDGENYQIGFISVTDTPYMEITQASRKIGNSIYSLRSD